MNNFIQITIKQWSTLVLFSLVSLGSSATAILKTNYESYVSTLGVQYHDGTTGELRSQGSLFYALGEDNSYTHDASFTKKYKDGQSNESYTHDVHTVVNSSDESLTFHLFQGLVHTGSYFGNSSSFENFSFNWNFNVVNDDALLNLVLLPGTGQSIFSLTNLTLQEVISFENGEEEYGISLKEGNNYLLSLNMENSAFYDGIENFTRLTLNNAIFPIPAPNNILILLFALIFLTQLRKPLK